MTHVFAFSPVFCNDILRFHGGYYVLSTAYDPCDFIWLYRCCCLNGKPEANVDLIHQDTFIWDRYLVDIRSYHITVLDKHDWTDIT